MWWLDSFKAFFLAPVFPDNTPKTELAAILSIVLNISIFGALIVTIGNTLGGNVPLTTSSLNIASIFIGLCLRWGLRQGHIRATGIIVFIITFILLTITNATLGSIRTPTASSYILLVVISRVLFGRWGAVLSVVLSSVAILGLIIAENVGLLPPPDLSVTITQWITYTLFFGVAGFITNYALNTIGKALTSADGELALRRQAEAALRQRETLLRAITNNMQEMVCLVSLEGRLQYVNPAFQRWLGYQPADLIGRSGFDLLHPEDASLLQSNLQAALYKERADELVTFRARHADGRYLWLEASAQLVMHEEGITGIVAVFRDVTVQREAEEQIRLLSRTVEASPVSIVMADMTGAIIYVNPKFTEVAGYTFAEARGHNLRILQSGQTPPEIYVELWQTILAGQMWSGEFLNKRKDGRFYWESTVISPITNAHGQITHFVAVKEDITARKQMELALHRRNEALAALHTITLDILKHQIVADLLQVFVQRAAELLDAPYGEMMLLEGEELVVQACTANQHFLVGERVHENEAKLSWQAVHMQRPIVLDNYLAWPERRSLYEQFNIYAVAEFPIMNGSHCLGVLAMGRDLPDYPFDEEQIQTGRLLAQLAALALDNAKLYTAAQLELAERKQAEESLRQSNVELQMRNEELDAFAHTVAHDLQNPMGVIVGFSELLLSDYTKLLNEQSRGALQAIANSGRKANSIIEALLLLASVRQQDVVVEPLAMGNIVMEALYRLADAVHKAGAVVQVAEAETWPLASGYGPWVEEIWVNYVSNALKYSGQPPRVVLYAMRQADGCTRFCVRDNGPGLTPEQQKRLFTPFERLGKVGAPGHGLGLAIVKRIAEKMGGTVGVESVVGQGSLFYFTLPAAWPGDRP
ncbi:MAG: PAS domain S-box protein [Anaerolinea sp.]|nr:PAS domain S-box protein [Anaerolinea sp.]